MSSPKPPLTIKFDFRSLIPDQDLNSNSIILEGPNCFGQSLPVTILAENLIPGHSYRTEYTLISPQLPNQVFNPVSSSLYASYSSQNFVSSLSLPNQDDPSVSHLYIIKAITTDITEGFSEVASRQVSLVCGPLQNKFDVDLVDTSPSIPDNIIDLNNCDNPLPLVGIIKNANVGKQYSYEFFGNPSEGIVFENKTGSVFAGDVNQNFNTKVALTQYPYVFVHASVTEVDTGISRNSQPVLLKCYQTSPCDVILPTGVNASVGIPTFKKCSNRGLTNASISSLYGGKGFSIGDKLTTTGGGGYGAEIEVLFGGITQETFSSFVGGSGFNIGDLIEVTGGGGSGGLIKIISGGLTNASINSLTGCSNFKVGDLLTTIGGGGSDALISVSATGANGSISSYSVINPGYGYTNVPSGVKAISGSGSCVSASFNGDNFTIPCVGGITYSSAQIEGGNNYNIGETLEIIGGGGSGAQVRILTGSLTTSSISLSGGSGYNVGDYLSTVGGEGKDVVIQVASTGNNGSIASYSILNRGYGFIAAPTGISRLTGSGTGAVFTGNSNNFSITSNGSLTKASIAGLLNIGSGYTVGSRLIAVGGGGSGGLIEIISVNNGQISDFIIKNEGSGYTSAPQLVNDDQLAISNQPAWNVSKYTERSFTIINPGCGYMGTPSTLTSINGDGNGADFVFDSNKFTDYAFIVVNAGSGYTDAPTGIIVRSGDGSGVVVTFNNNNFTIPCSGGITYASVNGLIGKATFILGEELIADGGEGSGGRIKITGVNNSGAVTSFVILNDGCGYLSAPTLKKLNGSIINGVSFDVEDFTDPAVIVTNPGSGFFDIPSGLEVLTGTGQIDSIFVQFNSDNFIEIVGPNPTPSSTPTPTVTPSQSEPARCDELQSAGGQNTISSTIVGETANVGQNYIIVANAEGLQPYSVLFTNGISPGTFITKVENYFANFDNRTTYKKLTLSSNITTQIPANTTVSIYTTDIRLIKVPYWPGTMNFFYDAYSVPDRFKVFAVPMDSRRSDDLLFDSGYRGTLDCGYATHIPGSGGSGNVQLIKPDGCIFIKVIVEAPCEGTAWEYSLSCPERLSTTISPTPTRTPTATPTPSSN